jgi:hypothetical protein
MGSVIVVSVWLSVISREVAKLFSVRQGNYFSKVLSADLMYLRNTEDVSFSIFLIIIDRYAENCVAQTQQAKERERKKEKQHKGGKVTAVGIIGAKITLMGQFFQNLASHTQTRSFTAYEIPSDR